MSVLTTPPSERDRTLELPGDGRVLSYALLGATEGPTVIVLDGPGSRGLARAASPAAAERGIRLVAPDRPGFFGSTPVPGRAIADWAADHAALLDALSVERAGILAQSGGTPYALAAAAALPERTVAMAFAGGLAPLDRPGALGEVGDKRLRTGIRLGRRAPLLLRLLLRAAARQDPEKAALAVIADLPAADSAVLEQPGLRALHVQATAEILSRPAALAQEIVLLGRPWGIDLGVIGAPASFWTGEHDRTHPPEHARRLAAELGGEVTIVPDAATFGLLPFYGAALEFASAADRR